MIKEQNIIFRRFLIFTDLFIVAASYFVGYFLRGKISNIYPFAMFMFSELRPLIFYIELLPMLLIIWGGLLYYFGMYKSSCIREVSEALLITFKTTLLGFVLFGSYVFILRMQEDISRLVIGFTFVAAAALISLEKVALLYVFRVMSKKGVNVGSVLIPFKSILIVGTGKRARKFIDEINKNPNFGINIVGLVDIDSNKKGEIINGHKVIGTLDDISEIIHKNIVDECVFIVPRSWLIEIEETMYLCEAEGLRVNLALDFFEFRFSKAKQADLYGIPLLTFESTPDKLGHLFIKRLFDFVVSGIGLILLAPVFVVIAAIVKITSKGPVFFKQERCSLRGRKFILYKFRTMVFDAETKLKDILKYNEMDGPVFKMTNDPRVTKAGKWLRKFSIDELPQLWNVFKGNMSLVGPRPPLPEEVDNYDNWQRRRLSMRPGITCLWQTSGRSKITNFEEWMRLDLEYIDNWSLAIDFKILLKTIPAVLFRVGAK